jgi:hypothetical protein
MICIFKIFMDLDPLLDLGVKTCEAQNFLFIFHNIGISKLLRSLVIYQIALILF